MWLSRQLGRGVVLAAGMVLIGGALVLGQQPQGNGAKNNVDTTLLAQAPTQSGTKQNPPSPSVKRSAPVVVETVPRAGETQVDATTTKEIRVKFSKDMQDGAWSFTQTSKEHFPALTGKPHYEKDKRTCVLPVQLEPGKTYVIWLNPERYPGFRDTDGKPAVFYPLVFETKP